MMILESYGREILRDDPTEIARATHHLDLVRANALGLQESASRMEWLHRELPELQDS
jgi:hypothetical protein